MANVQIRDAEASDLDTITAIHNDAILNTTSIWSEQPVDIADRAAWLAARVESGFPVIVAVDESGVLGYASFAQWRPHSGYRHTVEHSVYVHSDQRGRGIGRMLMEALIERARDAGIHAMVAGVDSHNRASIIMHKRLDFMQVGRMPQVGVKFGRWLDLTFLQLVLDERPFPDESR